MSFGSARTGEICRSALIPTPGALLPRIFFQSTIFLSLHVRSGSSAPFLLAGRTASPRGHDTMTADHRFRTYTQREKAYRRILARRMPARQKRRKLQTRYRQIIPDAAGVNAWIEKGRSDSLTPLRHMTVEGQAQA